MHTATIAITSITTKQAKSSKVKLSRNILVDAELNQNVLVPFLRDERDWRASSPPPISIHFSNTSSQNFEKVVLFSIVEQSRNYVSRDIGYVSPQQLCNRYI